ncbi:MAG: hypothetical protein ACKVOK_00240 [Flavobacteriales bacterium]
MKKILILFMCLVAGMYSSAQTQDWRTTGNTVTSDSRIGTNNGYDLIFETANLERMRLIDAGYFGIGTTLPTAPLHVVGEFNMDGDIRLGLLADANAESMRITYIDQNGILKAGTTDDILHALYSRECIFVPGEPLPLPVWTSETNENFGILHTGANCPARVGIGTSTPAADLQVAGSTLGERLFVGSELGIDNNYRIRIGRSVEGVYQPHFQMSMSGGAEFAYFEETGSPFTIHNGLANKQYMTMHASGTIDYNYFGATQAL